MRKSRQVRIKWKSAGAKKRKTYKKSEKSRQGERNGLSLVERAVSKLQEHEESSGGARLTKLRGGRLFDNQLTSPIIQNSEWSA